MSEIPRIDMQRTGQNIITLRKKKGISVKDLQKIFNFGTPNAIYKWQRGEALPTIDNLIVLSSVLSVSMEEIIAME